MIWAAWTLEMVELDAALKCEGWSLAAIGSLLGGRTGNAVFNLRRRVAGGQEFISGTDIVAWKKGERTYNIILKAKEERKKLNPMPYERLVTNVR